MSTRPSSRLQGQVRLARNTALGAKPLLKPVAVTAAEGAVVAAAAIKSEVDEKIAVASSAAAEEEAETEMVVEEADTKMVATVELIVPITFISQATLNLLNPCERAIIMAGRALFEGR